MIRLGDILPFRRALAAAIVVGIGTFFLVSLWSQQWLSERQNEVVEATAVQASSLRRTIESRLNSAANTSASVAAYLRSQAGDVDETVLRRMAIDLLDRVPAISSIAIAPDNVIRWNFPASGNEVSVGINLLTLEGQQTLIREAISAREPILAGPLSLLQGGSAVIHRVPVFVPDDNQENEEYWGLVNSRIPLDRLLRNLGTDSLVAADRLAIRGTDGLGARGDVFLGNEQLFRAEDRILEQIRALDGEWQLAMTPQPPARAVSLVRAIYLPGALVTGILLGVIVFGYLRNQARLEQSENRLRQITHSLNEVVFQFNQYHELTYLSAAYQRLSGRSSDGRLGYRWLGMFSPNDRNRLHAAAVALTEGQGPAPEELHVNLRTDEGYVDLPVSVRLSLTGTPGEVVGIIADRRGERERERLQQFAQIAFDHTDNPIVILDAWHRIQFTNPAYTRLVGEPIDKLIGHRLKKPAPTDWQIADYRTLLKTLRERGSWTGDFIWHVNGEAHMFQVTISSSGTMDGDDPHYAVVFVDLGNYYRDLKEARKEAALDPLTQLLNRKGLHEAFPSLCYRADTAGRRVALIMMDLDGFKPINDTYGHDAGDEVLVELAERLTKWRGDDNAITARLGGDEFVVVWTWQHQEDIAITAGELQRVIAAPITLTSGQVVSVGSSMGISCRPEHGDTVSALLTEADAALYRVKAAGKGHFLMAETKR